MAINVNLSFAFALLPMHEHRAFGISSVCVIKHAYVWTGTLFVVFRGQLCVYVLTVCIYISIYCMYCGRLRDS